MGLTIVWSRQEYTNEIVVDGKTTPKVEIWVSHRIKKMLQLGVRNRSSIKSRGKSCIMVYNDRLSEENFCNFLCWNA